MLNETPALLASFRDNLPDWQRLFADIEGGVRKRRLGES